MDYTIDKFWKSRFSAVVRPDAPLILRGWSADDAKYPFFVEATLQLRAGYNDLAAPIWFVAAPGAVGKSTLAKEISAQTGALYLDLAAADTVAGNYLTGGLVANNVLRLWQNQKTAILIDALDEARLRVTENSFEDFLRDVQRMASGRQIPTILFGRVGIVSEAWLVLAGLGMSCPIFDIQFFDSDQAIAFVMASLRRFSKKDQALANGLRKHESVYQNATKAFVSDLENAAAADGARFAGYAPVLEAVATFLGGVANPASLQESVGNAFQGKILQSIVDRVLDRESAKLRKQLPIEISQLVKDSLYGKQEQLDRLVAKLYGTRQPPMPEALPLQFNGQYEKALHGFVEEHPFLDGTGRQASGAVFGAVLNVHALRAGDPATVEAAAIHAGTGPFTPNPFLVDFYLLAAEAAQDQTPEVIPEHVVFLYDSVRARASAGDVIRMTIEGDEDGESADVEISIASTDRERPNARILLRTSQIGTLKFGRQVHGVTIDAPVTDVTMGNGGTVEIIAPVVLNVARLSFNCSELVIAPADDGDQSEGDVVVLEAQELRESLLRCVPLIRKNAQLLVVWPNAEAYPWSQFAAKSTAENEPDGMSDRLHALRRLILAFRSHRRGVLGRFKDKIEHRRMTKGTIGIAIRERLMRDGVLKLDGTMYILNSDLLGRVVGATYMDMSLKRFNAKVRDYVLSIKL